MKKKLLGIGLSVFLSGCGMNFVDLNRFSPEKPLVVVSDGLLSGDARKFFKGLCEEEDIPYVGEDNVSWFKNQEAIKFAYKQKREIILVGYSAGCDQVRIEAEWCKKEGIKVHAIFFDPTYLSFNSGRTIHENICDITNYLSERNIPDILEIGKGREINDSDIESRETIYKNHELKGTHLSIFDNNRKFLEKEIKTIIRNNYRRR